MIPRHIQLLWAAQGACGAATMFDPDPAHVALVSTVTFLVIWAAFFLRYFRHAGKKCAHHSKKNAHQ